MNLFSLLKEDKVFSTFYISGTAIAIASAMVMAIIVHILLSDIAPEKNRSNTVYVDNCFFQSEEMLVSERYSVPEFYKYGVSLSFLNLCRQSISGIEASTVYSKDNSVKLSTEHVAEEESYRKVEYHDVIFACPDFFRIYEMDFVCGRPFADNTHNEEYTSSSSVTATLGEAVITDEVAIECFGSVEGALGKPLYANGISDMMVVGVVKAVSSLLPNACADVYASENCYLEGKVSESHDLYGIFSGAIFLLSDDADVDSFRKEFGVMMGKYEKQISDLHNLNIRFRGLVRNHFGHSFGVNPDVKDDNDMFIFGSLLSIVMLLLLLLPAINLSGFVNNRMREQLPELGIRKTYGASKLSLLRYVFNQNLVLTFCGGIVGYPLAMMFISAMSNTELSQMIVSHINEGVFHGGVDIAMFFSPWLFIVAFGCCFVLTSLAALIPAITALRKPIIESLNLQR